MDLGPVGVFDSGFGGLSIVRALQDLLPAESIVYFGDTARYPYGSKSIHEVARYAVEIANYLIRTHGIKMLVVACNTASAAALEELTESLEVPVIGVIEAGARAASFVSEGRLAVIGTIGTISSGAYQRCFESIDASLSVKFQACPGLVEFVEKGEVDSEEVLILLRQLLSPLITSKIDTLLLGCTHYPFLSRSISKVMGDQVVLVSSGEETAFEVKRVLNELGLATGDGNGTVEFYSSGDSEVFRSLGSHLYGSDLNFVTQVVDLRKDIPKDIHNE